MRGHTADRLEELFQELPCWMLADLAAALGYAPISVRRFLKEVGYFRSYTHNGKWYTLGSLPIFDRDGLWHYEDRGFSRRGSLTQTMMHLIGKSPSGLSAKELAQKLHHPCDAVLTALYKAGQVDRLRAGRAFRYLSTRSEIGGRQRVAIEARRPAEPAGPLSTQTAVYVLVEFIKHPQLSLEEIAERLRKDRDVKVSSESITGFFEEHGLKKTADTRSRGP